MLPLIGAGLQLVGTGFQLDAAEREQTAMNRAVQAEIDRQKQYQAKSQKYFDQHVTQAGAPAAKADLQTGKETARKTLTQVDALPVKSPALESSPTMGAGFSDARVSAANRNSINGAAGMQSYNEWDVKSMIDTLKARTLLAQNADFARKSAATLPYDLQAAQQSQSMIGGIGSLLSTAGGVLSLTGGLGGGGKAAAGGAASGAAPASGQIMQPTALMPGDAGVTIEHPVMPYQAPLLNNSPYQEPDILNYSFWQ